MHVLRILTRFAACLALLWAVPAGAQTLRMVAHSDLKVLDPIWTTAFITRNHGYMVYDVLFAQDEQLRIQPQMVDKYEVSADKLTWTFTLRDGLEWHDGQPVTSEDCIASIKRWAARDALGQQLMASIGDLKAVDAKTFTLMLKEPFGLVLEALGKPSSNVPFMMPKRVADTDPNKQIDDYTGSGPFIFKKDEWKPGEKVVYVKNTKYKPRAEPPSMLAGGKVVKVDRVEWIAVTDPLTAVNALTQGEIDLIEVPVARPLPGAEGRQEHRAVRLERARQPDHHALQPPPSAVQQREGAPGGDVCHRPGGFPARPGRRSRRSTASAIRRWSAARPTRRATATC